MQSKITGTVLPVLQLGLEAGEVLVAETGQLSWMTENVELRTTMNAAGSSGFLGVIRRAFSGGGLLLTEYTARGGPGVVAFAAKVPGQILPISLSGFGGYMVHKHGFLCATQGVSLGTGVQQSLGAGIFGGDGFLLQHVTGTGQAWLELGGEVVCHALEPGETLLVHPGHVGAFEDGVRFEITTIPGIVNKLFGGDGLFLARLTGPGRLWLQTLTLPNLAHALSPYLGGESVVSTPSTAGGFVAGAVLRDVFGE